MALGDRPTPTELEISVFGPGRGECIVVHLGDDEWCAIDSCRSRGHADPVAVEYLRALGGDSINRIRLVVATHWHDDHIRGLSDLLRISPDALFASSTAVATREFATLLTVSHDSFGSHSGVSEHSGIFNLLTERKKAGSFRSPVWAIQQRRLLTLDAAKRSIGASVLSLSPSDRSVSRSLEDLLSLTPKAGQVPLPLVSRSPNHSSVVLWIEMGLRRVLLGADLENTDTDDEGWAAVLASCQSIEKACALKVPHHGSSNAHADGIWADMLCSDPICVVTPFRGGRNGIPKDEDLTRLTSLTSNLYLTATSSSKPPTRGRTVDKQMELVAKGRIVAEGVAGHVRIRWSALDADSPPTIELFNGARRIASQPAAP